MKRGHWKAKERKRKSTELNYSEATVSSCRGPSTLQETSWRRKKWSQIQVTFKVFHLICALHCSAGVVTVWLSSGCPSSRTSPPLAPLVTDLAAKFTSAAEIYSAWQSFYLHLSAGLIIISGRFTAELFSACLSFILSLHFHLPDEFWIEDLSSARKLPVSLHSVPSCVHLACVSTWVLPRRSGFLPQS